MSSLMELARRVVAQSGPATPSPNAVGEKGDKGGKTTHSEPFSPLSPFSPTDGSAELPSLSGNEWWDVRVARKLMDEADALVERLGVDGRHLAISDAAAMVVSAADLIRRGLTFYAGFTKEPAARFVEAVRADLAEWAEELARKVWRLERESKAVTRLLDNRTARKQATKLLPSDGRDDRIAKYERHLHTLLTSTLHELERLRARRDGESVPPPAVADVIVMVDTGPG